MDPLISYSISKFFLLFIPKILLDNLPTLITSFLVTIFPYTPIGAIMFTLLFIIIYFTDIFGLASKDAPYCQYNQIKSSRTISTWVALRNTYNIYFMLMLLVNYNTVSQYKFFYNAAQI
jgi:hypothetical protein